MRQPSMGARLLDALTRPQLIHLLDTAFDIGGRAWTKELVSELDEDVASTLSRLLDPKRPSEETVVSSNKQLETWRGLWSEWEEIVSELGDDEGRYAAQEYDGDPAYFDAHGFSLDLEAVAEKMLPLLDAIHEMGAEEDDLFLDALLEIDRGIRGYPGWMGVQESDCGLKAATTKCVLQWGRLTADSASDFVEWAAQLEDRLRFVGMDSEAALELFRGLPETDRKELYDAIHGRRHEDPWRERLDSPRSKWHRIYYDLRRDFDREGYLEDCRELLHQDWRYGAPLIEHLVSVGKDAEAETILEQTVSSLNQGPWKPEETLLVEKARYTSYHREFHDGMMSLIDVWLGIAERLGRGERLAALRFQRVAFETPDDWDAVVACYRGLREPLTSKTLTGLVDQWKASIVRAHLGWEDAKRVGAADCWPMWLLEAGLDAGLGASRFIGKVRDWLDAVLEMQPKAFADHRRLLTLLTCDLMDNHAPAAAYPRLRAVLCDRDAGGRPSIESRRAWLRRMDAGWLTERVIACWTRQLEPLVPDPGESGGSHYTDNVRWLAALQELDAARYGRLVTRWRDAHKRKRNLWKAMQEQGLPF